MITLLQPNPLPARRFIERIQAPTPSPRRTPNLILHCGARKVALKEIAEVLTPHPTRTWMPIAHIELINQVEQTLKANRLMVGTHAHSLSHDQARYFGLMEIQRSDADDDYCWVLGLRNSHDKTFPAGIAAGAQVLVCDNLSFSGEIKLARKHTRFILRDLPQLVQGAIGKLAARWHDQDERFANYKRTDLDDRTAHDLVIRALDVGVCPNRKIPEILRNWREPIYSEFEPRTVWSLFNGFTDALKGNLNELPRRTEALHGLLDHHVGLALTS